LGERLLCKQEVIGSIPFTSTTLVQNVKRKSALRISVWLLANIAVSIFNNLEEAKRFNLRLVMSQEGIENGL
jgi:hypothetical protein